MCNRYFITTNVVAIRGLFKIGRIGHNSAGQSEQVWSEIGPWEVSVKAQIAKAAKEG